MMSTVVACIDGGVVSVIAAKAYSASDLVVTLLASATALAHITSFLWAKWLHGHDRVKATVALQIGTIACVALAALSPFSTAGQWMLVALTLLARALIAGIITARGDLWRANYPRRDRGRITGKLSIIAAIILALAPIIIAGAMDAPWGGRDAFRPIFIAACLVALVGAWSFSKIRWRGRAAHLADERRHRAEDPETRERRSMLDVLRTDVNYRRYMIAMFALGLPNIAALPLFVIALEDVFPGLNYTMSITLTQVLPIIVPVLVIPLWAKLLDRMHIVRFRVFHAWFFVVANALMAFGLLFASLPMLFVARTVLGVAFGGGMLAWNLGHNDFAKRDLATIYMGIHVTLTGVRGLVGPFLGLILYTGFALPESTGVVVPGMGAWTFVLLASSNVVGALLFLRMHLLMRASGTIGAHDG